MQNANSNRQGYVLAALLGALGGGLIVLSATKAIPKMMSQLMNYMMDHMREQMGACGCNPAELCAQMMTGVTEMPISGCNLRETA